MELHRYKLRDIASVDISSVDKKSYPGQKAVKLCNFTDVYYNWAITAQMADSLMDSTASESEIERYTLRRGQVCITKDSETRDDIGVAAYIADTIENVVLGYHCAVITPDEEKLDGAYLNAFLHSAFAQKYFECNASGSGQRYTLTLDSIKDLQLVLPCIEEQRKVAKLLSDLDRKIELNKSINANLEAMAKQLYDYWFVQFDFPDENGRPYKSSGGKMIWNEKLKREIPEGWEMKRLKDITKKDDSKQVNPQKEPNKYFKHLSFPSFDTCGSYFEELGSDIHSNKTLVKDEYVLAAKLNPWIKRIGWGNAEGMICSTEFVILNPIDKDLKAFVYMLVKQDAFIEYCTTTSTGTSHSQRRVKPDIMMQYQFLFNEGIAQKYSQAVMAIFEHQQQTIHQNKELQKQRDELLPLLMNGQVSITE